MYKFHFVSVSRCGLNEIKDRPISKSIHNLEKLYPYQNDLIQISTSFTFNNKQGLSIIYNDALQNISKDTYVIFCHDDIEILDMDIFNKILKGHNEFGFDVLGIAGSKCIDFNKKSPLSWYHSSEAKDRFGCVIHEHQNKEVISAYSQTTYEKVFCIDGLFMVVSPDAVERLRFDETFDFHFYDLDFCMTCYNQKVNIGVIPVMAKHLSMGEGVRDNSYNELQNKFIEKWFKK